MPWHAYSLPQITMETLSVEAGLDAMALTYRPAYIRGCDAETANLKSRLPNDEQRQAWRAVTMNLTQYITFSGHQSRKHLENT